MIRLRFSAIAALVACALVMAMLVRAYPQENGTASRESSATGAAQGDGSVPAFRSGIDLVALNVTLTDGQDHFVAGLSQGDFGVFEDGVQQDISFFAFGRVPLDLAILLDTSSSMIDSLQTAQKAAVGFVETIREEDRVTTIQINDRAEVLHALTSDKAAAIAAIRQTAAHGATALYNALFVAMTEMVKSRRTTTDVRRQAIALLSDGQDTASLVEYDEVMALAKESGIGVCTISLLSPLEVRRLAHAKNKVLRAIAVRDEVVRRRDGRAVVHRQRHRRPPRHLWDHRERTGQPVHAGLRIQEPASRRRIPAGRRSDRRSAGAEGADACRLPDASAIGGYHRERTAGPLTAVVRIADPARSASAHKLVADAWRPVASPTAYRLLPTECADPNSASRISSSTASTNLRIGGTLSVSVADGRSCRMSDTRAAVAR